MLVYNEDEFIGFGHNEDGWNGTYNTGFFSNITIISNTNNVSFIVFQYPGSLLHAFGVNSNFVASSMNALFPTDVQLNGRGCYFLGRMMFDAKNIEDLIESYQNTSNGIISSYGVSLNIGMKINNNQYRIVNIEISSTNISVLEINHTNPYAYHFNNYLRLNVSAKNDTSSAYRRQRTQYMIQHNFNNSIKNRDEIIQILGDTNNTEYPIYRESISPDTETTLNTIIYDLISQNVYLYEHCNPKICSPMIISLDSI